LPTTRSVFESASEIFDLPKSFLQALKRGSKAFYSETCRDVDSKGFVLLNTGTSRGRFNMALTYNTKSRLTCGIVWSHDLISNLDTFLEILESFRLLADFPLLIPSIFIERKVEDVCEQIQFCKDALKEVEANTKHRQDDIITPHLSEKLEMERLDFSQITRKLTSLRAKLAHCKYNCNLHRSLVMFLEEVNASNLSRKEEGSDSLTSKAMVQERMTYLTNWLENISKRAEYLSDQANTQVQTVCANSGQVRMVC
jgi:hypothetical protein